MPDTARPKGTKSGPLILVTGATGKLGREVADRLRARGARVRRLVRRQDGSPPGAGNRVGGGVAPEAATGTESVIGDLTDRATVRAALADVDSVVLIWPLLDAAPAHGLVAELAEAAPRVVYVSSTAVDDGAARQSDPIVQVHADMEALLHDAGLRATVLRADTLASNALGWAPQLAAGDVVSGPDVARTAVVDERDVAAAAVAVLLARHDRPTDRTPFLLTGPEVLGRADQVAQLGAALGRELRFRAVPPDLARARLLADGRPERLVEALIAASVHRPESSRVTDHVERLTGRPAGTFAQWSADRVAEFS